MNAVYGGEQHDDPDPRALERDRALSLLTHAFPGSSIIVGEGPDVVATILLASPEAVDMPIIES